MFWFSFIKTVEDCEDKNAIYLEKGGTHYGASVYHGIVRFIWKNTLNTSQRITFKYTLPQQKQTLCIHS